MNTQNQTVPTGPKFIFDLARVRRETLLRQLAFETKSQEASVTAKNWMNFGVFIAALTPAYYLCIKGWGYANPNRHFISSAAASAGIMGYSLFYRWQSNKMLETSSKWQDLFKESTAVAEKSTITPSEVDALVEKHNAMKAEYRALTSYETQWNSRYSASYPEYADLFEAKKK
jgi:hypothetical protein